MGFKIFINGIATAGLLQVAVTTTNYFSSDTFSLTFAMGQPPLTDTTFWSQLQAAMVEVEYVDAITGDLIPMIVGRVDTLVVDVISQTVSIEGRDLSASLIDSYTQQEFANQTASEIVSSLANQFGLVVQIEPTSDIIGRFFLDGHTKISLGQFSELRSNWDLVVQLARAQSYDVFVQGTTLNFQPLGTFLSAPTLVTPRDVLSLRLERNLLIGSSTSVSVQSWSSQTAAAYSSSGLNTSQPSQNDPGGYLFSKSNLTPSQADMYATQYLSELTRQQTVLQMDMLWNFTIAPRTLILLQLPDSLFSSLYQVDFVERHYSSSAGSSQTVRAVLWDGQIGE